VPRLDALYYIPEAKQVFLIATTKIRQLKEFGSSSPIPTEVSY